MQPPKEHEKCIFETLHNEMKCVLSIKVLEINGKNGSKFSHMLAVRADGAEPPVTVSLTVNIRFFLQLLLQPLQLEIHLNILHKYAHSVTTFSTENPLRYITQLQTLSHFSSPQKQGHSNRQIFYSQNPGNNVYDHYSHIFSSTLISNPGCKQITTSGISLFSMSFS